MLGLRNERLNDFYGSLMKLSRSQTYQDVRLVCQDGAVQGSKLILALAFPLLADLLNYRDDEDLVVLLPEFNSKSLQTRIDQFLSGKFDRKVKLEKRINFEDFDHDVVMEEDRDAEDCIHGAHNKESLNDCLPIIDKKSLDDIKCEGIDLNIDKNKEESKSYDTKGRIIRNPRNSSLYTKEPKVFDCTDCDKTYSRRDNLYKHFRHMHPEGDISPFKGNRTMIPVTDPSELICPECNKFCGTRARLKDHMKRHSDEKNFICVECGKRFKGEDGLKAHTKKHRGEYDFPCDQCELKYVTQSALLNHKTAKHSDGMQFTCEHCGKGYSNRPSYSVHLTTHTGEKPYKCRAGCEKRFRKHGARDNHERQHRGIKEFHCHICSKEFMQKRQLVVHIKRHLGQKDHVCPVCNKAYVEASGARNCKHVQKLSTQGSSVSSFVTY